MNISSTHQMSVFLICIAVGLFLGMFFDFQRSLRRIFSSGKFRTAAEDLLFAVVFITAQVGAGYLFNDGQMRYYQPLGIIVGILLYAVFLSRIVLKLFCFFFEAIVKLFFKPLITLFGGIYGKIKKICGKIKRIAIRILKKASRSKKRLKKKIKML